jgi:AbrB family looped-hinge helix DNA binding protein
VGHRIETIKYLRLQQENRGGNLNMNHHTIHIGDTMDIEVAKVGERGQIVIPQEFREQLHIQKGEKFIVVKSGNKLILQQMKELKAKSIDRLNEDLIDMKIAEECFKEIERGEVVVQTEDEFFKEMEQWVAE